MFKKIRITILLTILVFVAGNTYVQKVSSRDWNDSLVVAIHPVDMRKDIASERFIRGLETDDFLDIEQFMAQQANEYGIAAEAPIKVVLAKPVRDDPPIPPDARNIGSSVFYSLQFRLWAWRNAGSEVDADIHMFVAYYDPDLFDEIPHSLALEKGMVGMVFAYADQEMQGTNNFIIAHEMLHTLGATDKYDLFDNMPIYPEGFARPFGKNPWVQTHAEIMGGRIPKGPGVAAIPNSLDEAIIGTQTALELNWFN